MKLLYKGESDTHKWVVVGDIETDGRRCAEATIWVKRNDS